MTTSFLNIVASANLKFKKKGFLIRVVMNITINEIYTDNVPYGTVFVMTRGPSRFGNVAL
jgi:hypothetical protein